MLVQSLLKDNKDTHVAWSRSYNPIWSAPDLDGAPMDDTYWFFTLQNILPYLPSPIYQDESASVVWSDPIQVLANGTLPENLYFNDELTYRLEWRAGPTQSDALIYLVENYVPGSNNDPAPGATTDNSDNQITNPQFATVYFTDSFTISAAGTYDIAPGWQVIAAGAGSAVILQETYTGDSWTPNNTTNAPYGLSLQNNGFTSLTLRQRFNGNGALWTGASSTGDLGPGVALNLTARSDVPAPLTASIIYSDASTTGAIISVNLVTTNNDYAESAVILESFNTDTPDVAYTDLDIVMPFSTTFHITSVQLIAQQVVASVPYVQTALERQEDHEFNVYNEPIQFMPNPSLLTGWDFALNPAQIKGSTVTVTTTADYVWDQTIMASAVANMNVTRNTATDELSVVNTGANDAFYILQYLSGPEAVETTYSELSVFLQTYCSNNTATARVYLFQASGASTIPVLPTTIGTIANTGVFTVAAAGWAAIPREMGSPAVYDISQNLAAEVDKAFSGWNGRLQFLNSNNLFAIVVTFAVPTITTSVLINSISLNQGSIPTRPAPQSAAQVLMDCEQYYEKSYRNVDIGGTATTANQKTSPLGIGFTVNGGGAVTAYGIVATAFEVNFQTQKRITPTVLLYSTAGTVANVSVNYTDGTGATVAVGNKTLAANWNTTVVNTKRANYIPTLTGAIVGGAADFNSGYINYHYVADSRLGVV